MNLNQYFHYGMKEKNFVCSGFLTNEKKKFAKSV